MLNEFYRQFKSGTDIRGVASEGDSRFRKRKSFAWCGSVKRSASRRMS